MAKKKSTYQPCWKTHPPLKFRIGNKRYRIWGGNCNTPLGPEFDARLGFDYGMKKANQPWDGLETAFYEIRDMSVPKDIRSFRKMLEWLHELVISGKQVHLGCIGGHGRTGLVMVAYLAMFTKKPDPLGYVRAVYCKKAVESQSQMDWLHKHFGVSLEGHKPVKSYASSINTPARVASSDLFEATGTTIASATDGVIRHLNDDWGAVAVKCHEKTATITRTKGLVFRGKVV